MTRPSKVDELLARYPEQVRETASAGKVHRHVPLRSGADLEQPGLKALLAVALAAWKARNA